ncbi:hypothetical protein DY000_02056737 [Brassica cretica]|uniref:AP2/ERF domain-containing protein n=1 Tax=Brassica cretica TaxID=69181 RepID=A0ABQ7AII8_BRACR|nr:hypothetical protein DY000_02056737 [Brassica cretica]
MADACIHTRAYDDEEATARAYDLAALKYWGPGTIIRVVVAEEISGGAVKKNGGQGDVVVVGFTSHYSLRLDEEDL